MSTITPTCLSTVVMVESLASVSATLMVAYMLLPMPFHQLKEPSNLCNFCNFCTYASMRCPMAVES